MNKEQLQEAILQKYDVLFTYYSKELREEIYELIYLYLYSYKKNSENKRKRQATIYPL